MNRNLYLKENLSKRHFFQKRSYSAVFWIILLSCLFTVLTFILEISFCGTNLSNCAPLDFLALRPSNFISGMYLWTIVTHIFVHGGFFHLFVNLVCFFSLGQLSERILGKKRFLIFFILAGIFAGLMSAVFSVLFGNSSWGSRIFGSPNIYMVGSSGAIFALAGLFVVLLPKIRFGIIFLPFFSFPAYIIIPTILIILWVLSVTMNLPLGNVAHASGFIFGLIYGEYLRLKYRNKVNLLRRMIV